MRKKLDKISDKNNKEIENMEGIESFPVDCEVSKLLEDPEYFNCKKCNSNNMLHDGNGIDSHFIKCLDCNYVTDTYADPYDALAEWNKRE